MQRQTLKQAITPEEGVCCDRGSTVSIDTHLILYPEGRRWELVRWKECSRQRPYHILSHGCEGHWLAQRTEKKFWGEVVRMTLSWRTLWAMLSCLDHRFEDMRCLWKVLSSKATSYFGIRKIILNAEWSIGWRLEVGNMSRCWVVGWPDVAECWN